MIVDKFTLFGKKNSKKATEIQMNNIKNSNSQLEKKNKNLDQDILNSLLRIGD